MLRCTRLADLVNTMDPELVAAAFGMNPEGVMIYLADHVDEGRLPACPPSASPARRAGLRGPGHHHAAFCQPRVTGRLCQPKLTL